MTRPPGRGTPLSRNRIAMDNGLTLEERLVLWDKARKAMIEFVLAKMAEEDERAAHEAACPTPEEGLGTEERSDHGQRIDTR